MNIEELKHSINEWITELDDGDRVPGTINQYKRALNRFLEYLEQEEITEIDRRSVTAYKNSMKEEVKYRQTHPLPGRQHLQTTTTANKWLDILNRLFDYMGRTDLKQRRIKDETQNIRKDVLTDKEYHRILEWADRLNKPKIKLILETLAGTGMRVSELEYITVESVRPRNRIAIVENKGKTRYVFIPKQLAKKLRDYAKANGIESGIIFHGRNPEKMISTTYIRREFKEIAGKARGIKLDRIHPHALRNLFARRYNETPDAPRVYLPYLLGHSQPRTVTERYEMPTDTDLKEAVDMMEAYYIKQDKEAKKKGNQKKEGYSNGT